MPELVRCPEQLTWDWCPIMDSRIPEQLRHVEPPCRGFWYAGDLELLAQRPRIGIVGSRHPRTDSRAVAIRIARGAARTGFPVVSGLAMGIDAVAHEEALAAGTPTIAVLAGGLQRVHPKRNVMLARRIAGSESGGGVAPGLVEGAPGLVVSEFGRGDEDARPFQFQQRNRIIAALSDYLVVVQAHTKSGSMGTANRALELGVPVGVVPSAPTDSCYSGSIELIQQGADAVVDVLSLCKRLELHGVMNTGFAAAARHGAKIDPVLHGTWTGGGGGEQLPLFDHPFASLLHVPRTAEELSELAGLRMADTRAILLELEDHGHVTHGDDGTWWGSN